MAFDAPTSLRVPLASGRRVGPLARAALSSSAGIPTFLAVSPAHIWHSREARPYTANVFLILASALLFLRLIESVPRTKNKSNARLKLAYAAALPVLFLLGRYLFVRYYVKIFDHLGKVLTEQGHMKRVAGGAKVAPNVPIGPPKPAQVQEAVLVPAEPAKPAASAEPDDRLALLQ